jgi:hypothetical protein
LTQASSRIFSIGEVDRGIHSHYAGSIKAFSNIARLGGAKYKISGKELADSLLWTPDGKQIVFASGQRLMSVDLQTTPSFAFSESKALPIEIENTQGRPLRHYTG